MKLKGVVLRGRMAKEKRRVGDCTRSFVTGLQKSNIPSTTTRTTTGSLFTARPSLPLSSLSPPTLWQTGINPLITTQTYLSLHQDPLQHASQQDPMVTSTPPVSNEERP